MEITITDQPSDIIDLYTVVYKDDNDQVRTATEVGLDECIGLISALLITTNIDRAKGILSWLRTDEERAAYDEQMKNINDGIISYIDFESNEE